MYHACEQVTDSAFCQQFVKQWWPDMANCLYSDWTLSNMSCEYFGGCGRFSRYWGCYEVADLFSSVLNSEPSAILGYELNLHGSCFCGRIDVANDFQGQKNCQEDVTKLAPHLLPALSTWVNNQTKEMCTSASFFASISPRLMTFAFLIVYMDVQTF